MSSESRCTEVPLWRVLSAAFNGVDGSEEDHGREPEVWRQRRHSLLPRCPSVI